MPLSEGEQALWQHCVRQCNDIQVDEKPPALLPLPYNITEPWELEEAILDAASKSMIDEDAADQAQAFMRAVWESGDPRATVAEIPRNRDEKGRWVMELIFPRTNQDNVGDV